MEDRCCQPAGSGSALLDGHRERCDRIRPDHRVHMRACAWIWVDLEQRHLCHMLEAFENEQEAALEGLGIVANGGFLCLNNRLDNWTGLGENLDLGKIKNSFGVVVYGRHQKVEVLDAHWI